MKTFDRGYIVFDIKTTGDNKVNDKIYYIDYTIFDKSFKPIKSFSTFINPNKQLPSEFYEKIGKTRSSLEAFPTFEELSEVFRKDFEGYTWCTFTSEKIDVLEFLRSSLFFAGVEKRYPRNKFVNIDKLEDALYPKTIKHLYKKYTGGDVIKENYKSKVYGDILKYQTEIINKRVDVVDLPSFLSSHKSTFIEPNNYCDIDDDGDYILTFGKYKGCKFDDIPEEYLYWITENNFPMEVRNLILTYLGYEF